MFSDRDVGCRGSGRHASHDPASPYPARRRLLTLLASSATSAAALPAHWTKPVADAVLLPAHAQTSGPGSAPPPPGTPCSGLRIDFQWGPFGAQIADVDGALVVQEPSGIFVGPPGANAARSVAGIRATGQYLAHLGDAGRGATGSETVARIPATAPGTGEYVVAGGFGDSGMSASLRDCNGDVLYTTPLLDARFQSTLMELFRFTLAADGSIGIDDSRQGEAFCAEPSATPGSFC